MSLGNIYDCVAFKWYVNIKLSIVRRYEDVHSAFIRGGCKNRIKI